VSILVVVADKWLQNKIAVVVKEDNPEEDSPVVDSLLKVAVVVDKDCVLFFY